MKIDIESERVVIDLFRKANVSALVISEEHGSFDLIPGTEPEYTIYLDGFDGSSVFRDSQGSARGGAMFAVYGGLNPTFGDYIASCITDHTTQSVVIAVKDSPVRLITEKGEQVVHTKHISELTSSSLIYIDEGVGMYPDFPEDSKPYFYDKIKGKFTTHYLGSSAVYGYDLATGEADLVLEYGRKNNLEHMVDYPLITEAGGVMVLLKGESLSAVTYEQYCQLNSGYPAVVMAANQAVLQSALNVLAAS